MKLRKIQTFFDFLYRSKRLLAIICAVGVGCVAYGMAFKNDPVFIMGIILVVVSYLIIRKHLKDSLKEGGQPPKDD